MQLCTSGRQGERAAVVSEFERRLLSGTLSIFGAPFQKGARDIEGFEREHWAPIRDSAIMAVV